MRVNKEMLQRRVALLNNMTGAAQEPYKSERDSRGGLIANAGTYYISGAYGGYRLERMCKGGGAIDISPRLSKPALADWINAYIDGIEIGRRL
jgi:hypothetical protein